MTEQLTADLLKIIRAVRILSDTSCTLAGRLISTGGPRQGSSEPAQNTLVEFLARQLYRQCYCRRFDGVLTEEPFLNEPDDEFVSTLSKANTSREYLERGWRAVRQLPTGHDVAEKNGLARVLSAGEFIADEDDGAAPLEGKSISLLWPRDSRTLHPGFYFVFGEAITDQQDDDKLLRFYWNVRADGAPRLVRLLTERLNRWQVPFRLKCLNSPSGYTRADAVVLYLNKRYYRLASELLAGIHEELKEHLRPETPLFSKQLADGLGLAEEPGNGESFGQQRCRVLAEGLWRAHERNLETDDERLAEVERQFASKGLRLDAAYLNPGSTDEYDFSPDPAAAPWMSPPPESFLETAAFLGARLCRDAIWDGRRCNWVAAAEAGAAAGRGRGPSRRACGADLYGGTSGIAVFLARLYAATGERIFRLTAEGAIRQSLSRLDDFEPQRRVGLYTGLTGIAYVLVELSEILDAAQFAPMALLIFEEVCKDDPATSAAESAGVFSGSAGVIPALLEIHRRRRADFLFESAVRRGEHLLETAVESEDGWNWPGTPPANGRLSGGFAHGREGIALALLELSGATGQERFRRAAEEAFRGVRAAPPEGSAGWSDGAAGIALARLRAYELTAERRYLDEAQAALQTIATLLRDASSAAGVEDFSLARGEAGAAEALLRAGHLTGHDGAQRALAELTGRRGIERYRRDNLPWPCAAPSGAETPGLMTGLAGIGYFYLRLAAAAKTPSMLLISPGADADEVLN
jgi:hypothetical protein